MEEVEALATSVAIISTSMLASGTTQQLRDQYGGYFHIRANTNINTASIAAANSSMDTYLSAVRSTFVSEGREVHNLTTGANGQIKFSIRQSEMTFGGVMMRMEKLKAEGVVVAYTVNGATLEEVFLRVCGGEK